MTPPHKIISRRALIDLSWPLFLYIIPVAILLLKTSFRTSALVLSEIFLFLSAGLRNDVAALCRHPFEIVL